MEYLFALYVQDRDHLAEVSYVDLTGDGGYA